MTRPLTFERLEERWVLSAASLVGTVFNDALQGIGGVDVQLSGNGPDGQANTPDDVLLTTVTGTGGQYQFDGLAKGSYSVQLPATSNNNALLSGLQPPPGIISKSVEVTDQHVSGLGTESIDSFFTSQFATDIITMSVPQPGSNSSSSFAPEAIGGARDLFVEWTGGQFGEVSLNVNPFGDNSLQFDTSAGARGTRIVQWDGPDQNPEALSHTGLGGIDLTDGGANIGVRLNIWADHGGGQARVTIYSDANNASEAMVTIPETMAGDGSDVGAVDVFFSSLGSNQPAFATIAGQGADFTNVGAIELEIVDSNSSSVDGRLTFLGTVLGPQVVDFNHDPFQPEIDIEKLTNGADADDRFGTDIPVIAPGDQVTWTYVVTNPGNAALSNIVVVDDNGTPNDTSDDFNPAPELVGAFNVGDVNQDNLLDPGETWRYTATGTALDLHNTTLPTVDGKDPTDPHPLYENAAVVTGEAFGVTVTDEDLSHYCNPPLAALGDFVWHDVNANGIQEAGEPGVGDVTVELLDDSGNVLDTTTTDANGKYRFDDLEPGKYQVRFSNLPDGYRLTQRDRGNDDRFDSDAHRVNGTSQTVMLDYGDENLTLDAGIVQLASLGDFVWKDVNANGIQEPGELGVANVTVELLDDSGNVLDTTTTDVDGKYRFDDLEPGKYQVRFSNLPDGYSLTRRNQGGDDGVDSDAHRVNGTSHVVMLDYGDEDLTLDAGVFEPASLGDYVWEDRNDNGLQDPGEPGINGVLVNLLNGQGNPVRDAQGNPLQIVTADNPANGEAGFYQFTGLFPGDYQVEFVPPTSPSSGQPAEFTQSNAGGVGSDSADSDVNPATSRTHTVSLTPGSHNPTIDAGIRILASALGDYVWLDVNRDGIQDAREPGIAGVTVKLLDSSGAVLQTTTTDATGLYRFDVFPPDVPGNFRVMFTLPAGYGFTKRDQGSDSSDSDVDPLTGMTDLFPLPDGTTDLTFDAGLIRRPTKRDFLATNF